MNPLEGYVVSSKIILFDFYKNELRNLLKGSDYLLVDCEPCSISPMKILQLIIGRCIHFY